MRIPPNHEPSRMQTAECDGRRRTIRRAFGLRLVKEWIYLRERLFGKAALQTLEPEDEIGFRNSMPPWLLHPHRGHGPQRKLERLVNPKSLQRRMGSQLAVAVDEAGTPLLHSHRIPPAFGSGRHQVGAELPQVIARFSCRVIVKVQQRELVVMDHELVVLEVAVRR